MVFIADNLGVWLTGLLADAGRKKLTTLVLGTDQERALRSAATAAVQLTAEELRSGDDEQTEHVTLVISQVFGEPVPAAPLAGQATLLEALQAGIAGQLAVLDDASLTGTGQSSAAVLGVPGTVLAAKLTGHLLREIVVSGARGGPLFPLASQLNDDVTHLQGQQLQSLVGELAGEVREALARLDNIRAVAANPLALAKLPARVVLEPFFLHTEQVLALLGGERAEAVRRDAQRRLQLPITMSHVLAEHLAASIANLGIAELQGSIYEHAIAVGDIVGVQQAFYFKCAKARDREGDEPIDFHGKHHVEIQESLHGRPFRFPRSGGARSWTR